MPVDGRRLGKRVTRIFGLATLICSLAACAVRTPQPPAYDGSAVVRDDQALGQKDGRTQGTLSESAVPPPIPPSIVVSRGPSNRSGVLLAVEWAAEDGSRITRSPDRGDAVSWVLIDGATDKVIEFTLTIGIPAVRMDLRTFTTGVGAGGVPEGDPLIVICNAKDDAAPGGVCTMEVHDGVTTVRWLPSTGVRNIVLSGVWHIPASAQVPGGLVDDSASWAFRLQGSQ